MINYDSIISAYNDKPTLMEWLKKVEEALKGASATSFSVNKKGNATISFQIDFEDGTSLESGDIVLQQGESVTGASIVNGHLILTLSNGDNLDAGSVGAVSSFSIDASQHLIVTYQDGTTNDLGAIFSGNVNISGILSASSISTPELTTSAAKIDVLKPVEVAGALKSTTLEQTQANYNSTFTWLGANITNLYSRVIVVNGVLWLVTNIKLTAPSDNYNVREMQANISLPADIAAKVYDFRGHTAAEAVAANTLITMGYAGVYGNDTLDGYPYSHRFETYVENRTTANMISFYFRCLETYGYDVAEGTEVYFSARIPLTLL